MKVHVKGGPWTNTEDEMLRAGVMKYGKQNWGRVASLVTRKTAAQCKARWAEWLDPAINKGEWAHDEDERLLELFQVMPHMWRTIAGQLHGRTAGMCNERYEILLDRARRKEAGEEATDKVEFATMDHHHESKPARADAADQDQYERDMLDAARGRLANTKGKKELRRMRDRKLQEARHRADMQRQRELREAGAAAAATTVSASVAAKAVGDVDHREGGAGPYDATADDAAAERLRRARARDDEADFTPVDVAVVDGAAPKKRVREGEATSGAQAAAAARPAAPPKIASFSFTFDSKQASAARTARRAAATAVAAPPAAAAAAIAAALPTLEINAEQRLKAKATAGQSFLALFNRTAGAPGADDDHDDSLGPALRQSLRPAPRPLLSAVASLSADAWASSAAPGTAEELVAKETVTVMKADLFAATAAGPQRRTDAAVAGAYAVSDDDPRALAQRLVQAELAATAAQEAAALAAITPLTVKATTVQPPQGPMCLASAAELDSLRAEARALLRVRDDLRAIGDRSAAALLRAAPVPRSVVPAAGDEAARLGRLELARTLRRYSCASDVYRRVRDDELASIAAMRPVGDAVATTAAATACD